MCFVSAELSGKAPAPIAAPNPGLKRFETLMTVGAGRAPSANRVALLVPSRHEDSPLIGRNPLPDRLLDEVAAGPLAAPGAVAGEVASGVCEDGAAPVSRCVVGDVLGPANAGELERNVLSPPDPHDRALVANALGVTPQGASNLVRQLEDRGWLQMVGQFGRGGRNNWVAPEVFDAVSDPAPPRRTEPAQLTIS